MDTSFKILCTALRNRAFTILFTALGSRVFTTLCTVLWSTPFRGLCTAVWNRGFPVFRCKILFLTVNFINLNISYRPDKFSWSQIRIS